MTNALVQAAAAGQSAWYDNIRRGLLTSGALAALIDKGIRGVTSNPTIFERAVLGSSDYDDALIELVKTGGSAQELFEALSVEDIQGAADLLRELYDATDRADGYASYELPPSLSRDTDGSIREAHRLFKRIGRPNIMIKVPATEEGLPTIRRLIGDGVNVNVTLIFSLARYEQVMEAYIAGIEDLVAKGGNPAGVASVASFFVSRVDSAVDPLLLAASESGNDGAAALTGKTAVANARVAYARFHETFGSARFAALRARGAQVQRPLWASTSTKDPSLPDTIYFDELVGPDTVNTMPDATVEAVLDHGTVEVRLNARATGAKGTLTALRDAGVNLDDVTAQLLEDGLRAFSASYDSVVSAVRAKCMDLAPPPPVSLAGMHAQVDRALRHLEKDRVIARIWEHDHTVWSPDPTEIADRLGWLTLAEQMRPHVAELEAFATEIRAAGYNTVVLLAMGGSAFAPELYRSIFGCAEGCPDFIMLDSTVPGWVASATERIDPAKTLFIVSSKSGGTIEVLSFYRHFRSLVNGALGQEAAGPSFIAITDPGTSLARLAEADGFRRVFANPPDIGGRFSGLSLFGLVPAALIGMDVSRFLDSAARMEALSRSEQPGENPGAWLGAAIAALAQRGVDKVALLMSPRVAALGLWLEQLVAESLGKDGKGVVPIAGEPPAPPSAYNDDRLTVYVRLAGDDNAAADLHAEALRSAGKPLVRYDVADTYDLGGELYRWEFAIATVGALMGIHVFNQPNVQEAKDIATAALDAYQRDGKLPEANGALSTEEALAMLKPGDYVSFQVYQPQSGALDAALDRARRAIVERYGVPVAAGYGPRYLHSTGQLHKAGPNSGVFIQVVGRDGIDVPIAGQPYSFGVLADAQADGDLRSMLQRGRRVARVAAGADPAGAVEAIAEAVRQDA